MRCASPSGPRRPRTPADGRGSGAGSAATSRERHPWPPPPHTSLRFYSSSTSSAGTTTASCWSPAQAFSRTCNCRIDLRSHRGTYTLHDLINHFDTEDNLNQQMMCDGTPLLCPEIHQRRQQQDRGRGWELGCRRWGACQRA
jgi:hypothetical protein